MWRDNWASRMLFTGPERRIVSQGLFDGLDQAARDELHARLRPRVLPAGAVLCRAGDRSDSLYLVERGVLHVLDGNTGALLGRQRAGDVVGEVALLTGEPRSATLLARVPGAVSELSREAFLAVATAATPRVSPSPATARPRRSSSTPGPACAG
jgi:voltage-gated potassium channel